MPDEMEKKEALSGFFLKLMDGLHNLAATFAIKADGLAFVESVVSPNTTIHADEASHWDALHTKYATKRINHQQTYSLNGACTNQAELFLARLRRMVTRSSLSRWSTLLAGCGLDIGSVTSLKKRLTI